MNRFTLEELLDDPLDECKCGDYRRDHINGTGACKHNKPRDLTHGYQDCHEFRLHRRAKLSLPGGDE